MKGLLSGVALCAVVMMAGANPARADKAGTINALFEAMEYDKLVASQKMNFNAGLGPLLGMLRCSYPRFNRTDELEVTRIFNESMGMAEIKKFTASLYEKYFTEAELMQLVEFYKTPAGKKMVQVVPQIMAETTAFGMKQGETAIQRVQDNVSSYLQTKQYEQLTDQKQLETCLGNFLNQVPK